MSMAVGIPNLLLALLVASGGLIVTVVLGIIVFRIISDGGSDDPMKDLCFVLCLIMLVFALIIAIVLTVISILFAFAVAGQTIGGWNAYKGYNYGSTVVLIFLGTFSAFTAGIILIVYSLASELDGPASFVALFLGLYELLSFGISLASAIMVISTKSTFTEKKRKGLRQKLKERKENEKKE
jgi:hypothetical protein